MGSKRTDDESDGERPTHGDVFAAHADRCVVEYHLAKMLHGLIDPVIVIDAPDPSDPEDVEVESRERLEVAFADSASADLREALLKTPAARLDVLVLFGDEVHGYTMDRPPG